VPRLARNELPDGFFHITVRGVARGAIFRDELDYADFRDHLLRVGQLYGWTIHAYCLMPNHYHLVIETTQADLSRGMHRLNGRYAQRFNQRYDRVGHVFQNRFNSYVIESEQYLERALAYVRANPVEAGLCARDSDWPWVGGVSDRDVS
jgi:putative transposase